LIEHRGSADYEEEAVNPEVHHNIGKSEAFPEHIGVFVMNHSGDPAVNV
jgi:hypothetical protein